MMAANFDTSAASYSPSSSSSAGDIRGVSDDVVNQHPTNYNDDDDCVFHFDAPLPDNPTNIEDLPPGNQQRQTAYSFDDSFYADTETPHNHGGVFSDEADDVHCTGDGDSLGEFAKAAGCAMDYEDMDSLCSEIFDCDHQVVFMSNLSTDHYPPLSNRSPNESSSLPGQNLDDGNNQNCLLSEPQLPEQQQQLFADEANNSPGIGRPIQTVSDCSSSLDWSEGSPNTVSPQPSNSSGGDINVIMFQAGVTQAQASSIPTSMQVSGKKSQQFSSNDVDEEGWVAIKKQRTAEQEILFMNLQGLPPPPPYIPPLTKNTRQHPAASTAVVPTFAAGKGASSTMQTSTAAVLHPRVVVNVGGGNTQAHDNNSNNKMTSSPKPNNYNKMMPTPNPTSCKIIAICVKCGYPGADVRVRCHLGSNNKKGGCAFHARCLDLTSMIRCGATSSGMSSPVPSASSLSSLSSSSSSPPKKRGRGCVSVSTTTCEPMIEACTNEVHVQTCPGCQSSVAGLEILPLCFAEMDSVNEMTRAAAYAAMCGAPTLEGESILGEEGGRINNSTAYQMATSTDSVGLSGNVPSHAGTQPRRSTVQCYDPSQPRTGRWTDEESLFRDALIAHFLEGSLPLMNGLKLNDFVPTMLKSKQSRLAKKMKHARLSTKLYHPVSGCIISVDAARELGRLELEFVNSIPDAIERSEINFHMGREWREHMANRLRSLRIAFDGAAWLGSVEDMERRLTFERQRHRLTQRKFMMGNAIKMDTGEGTLERGVFVDNVDDGRHEIELKVEESVNNSSVGDANAGGSMGGPFAAEVGYHSAGVAIVPVGGGTGRTREEPSPSAWTGTEPNFKHAAPFLSGIASYIERNGVPFEHVDVWAPSIMEDGTGTVRLCFCGSMTMGVQIIKEGSSIDYISHGSDPPLSNKLLPRCVTLSSEDKYNLSLFGLYSEKFSFQSGCGLPGRIYKSGNPTWEQFVCQASPNLFERRGGALQFGVKTALGLPIDSPSVGRVVLVLYSRHDRKKDEGLVARMMCDLKLLCPAPRWKLVVDVDASSEGGRRLSIEAPPPAPSVQGLSGLNPTVANSSNCVESVKGIWIKNLLTLLASNIPSSKLDGPLGQHLQSFMSLRLILLRGNSRTPEEEQLVETVLVLYRSYLHAGRNEADIAVMIARDYDFHVSHSGGSTLRNMQAASMMTPASPSQSVCPSLIHSNSGSPLMAHLLVGLGRFNVQQQQHLSMQPRVVSNPMMNYNHAASHRQQNKQHQKSMGTHLNQFSLRQA